MTTRLIYGAAGLIVTRQGALAVEVKIKVLQYEMYKNVCMNNMYVNLMSPQIEYMSLL